MSWMQLSLNTTQEAVDWIRTLLATANYADDLQITNYSAPEPPSSETLPWAFTIRLYLANTLQANSRAETLAQLLSPLQRTGLTSVLEKTIVDEKFSLAEELYLGAHRIGQRFVVLTSDAPYQLQANDVLLKLRTSLSFGSGLHPATMLALQLLERYVLPGMNALDFGCGSGILSVAMAKLGAQVLALDNDPIAVQSTQDTIALNGLLQQVTVKEGSLGQGSSLGHWMGGDALQDVPTIAASETFDLIVANILARIHIALASDFKQALRRSDPHTGILITAGYTADYEAEVNQALTEAGFELLACERSQEWVALAHRRSAD